MGLRTLVLASGGSCLQVVPSFTNTGEGTLAQHTLGDGRGSLREESEQSGIESQGSSLVTIAELEEPHATQGLEVLRLMAVGSSDSDQAVKATSHSPHLPISARLAVTREKRGTSSEVCEDSTHV